MDPEMTEWMDAVLAILAGPVGGLLLIGGAILLVLKMLDYLRYGRVVTYVDVPREVEPPRQEAPIKNLLETEMDAARALVDAVKARVGELRMDTAWVIANPAFLDVDAKETANLFTLLGDWNDSSKRWTPAEVMDAGARIDAAFVAARRHAEKVGMRYYDRAGRKTAARAKQLAQKAASTTSPHERDALLAKCAEILAGLLPYQLPATRAITSG